jgi:hypothetical protein
VDVNIGVAEDDDPNHGKNPAAVALVKLAGLKGGKLGVAAKVRWSKSKEKK